MMNLCVFSKYGQGFEMKDGIHPKYHAVTATCVCGNTIEMGSTKQQIRVEICSNCHPYYTGTQKIVDTEGRVDRFMKRYKKDTAATT
jgi:large subunit ribosomal protein L31